MEGKVSRMGLHLSSDVAGFSTLLSTERYLIEL